MEEIWKDISGYNGIYQVSNLGRIRSYTRKVIYPSGMPHTYRGKIIEPERARTGYLRVSLSKNSVEKKYFVHRLVAGAFLDNPDNLPQVNHKDENPGNNNVENLEWCSVSYNINYGTRNAKLSKRSRVVKQIDSSGHIVAVYKSVMDLSQKTGFDFSAIYGCCRGSRKTYKGFRWEYV